MVNSFVSVSSEYLVCHGLVSCYFTLFYGLLDLSCSECDVISLYCMCCPVSGSVCLVCCVFLNCLVKQFAICLGVVVILLLNVMEVFSVGGDALLDRPCMVFQISVVSVIPVCIKCSFHRFCCMSDVISSFKSLRAGSQVFALICGRVRACSCYAYCPSVCCACLPLLVGESDDTACDPPPRLSLHLAGSSITSAGSAHKSSGDNTYGVTEGHSGDGCDLAS